MNENQRLKRTALKSASHSFLEKSVLIESCGHESKLRDFAVQQTRLREEKTALVKVVEEAKRKLTLAQEHISVLVCDFYFIFENNV